MTIYAYVHTVGKPGAEKQILATTYDSKYLPEGVNAVEFPDNTPLVLSNGVIEPQYTSALQKAATDKVQQLKLGTAQTIEQGFSWNGTQITLSTRDQANNQLSLSVASYSQLTAVAWQPGVSVVPTTVVTASGTYWHPMTAGTTGPTEPEWSSSKVTDAELTWQEILFQVGTASGNTWVTVPEALELGSIGAAFVNSARHAYQTAKAQVTAVTSLSPWASGTSYTKGAQIFVPQTGAIWATTTKGKSGGVQPSFSQTSETVSDGTTAWSYVAQAETLVAAVTL